MTSKSAFSKGIVKGLEPYAKKHTREVRKVTTPEEQKELDVELKKIKINRKLLYDVNLNKKIGVKKVLKKDKKQTIKLRGNFRKKEDYVNPYYNKVMEEEKKALLSWD